MVDVEETALGAFEQDALTGFGEVAQNLGDVCRHRRDQFSIAERLVQGFGKIDRFRAEIVLQQEVVVVENLAELGGEDLAHEDIRDAQRAPRHLVLVGRADTPPGRADGTRAARLFARIIERHVRRQDQRTARAHFEPLVDRHAALDQRVRLLDQRVQRQHDAVADQAAHAVAQDARRNQVQHRLLAADDERVTGIVAALETCHRGSAVGQQVNDFTFTLVTPLRANDNYILPHEFSRYRPPRVSRAR